MYGNILNCSLNYFWKGLFGMFEFFFHNKTFKIPKIPQNCDISLLHVWACLDAQSCPTLCNPLDCSLSGSSVHGILQARILEWVAMPSSRGSSSHRDQICVSCTAGGFFTHCVIREAAITITLEEKNYKIYC